MLIILGGLQSARTVVAGEERFLSIGPYQIETSERAKHLQANGISENDIKGTHGHWYST
jgi:hypothetical protein